MNVAIARWFLALIACSTLLAGCRSETTAAARPDASMQPRQVAVVRPEPAAFEETISATGSLLAYEEAQVSLRVAGRIQSFSVDLGSCVERGAVIARVEPEELELRVKQAEAALAQAEARLGLKPGGDLSTLEPEQTATVKQAQAVLLEASRKRDRTRELHQQGIVARADLDVVDSEYAVAQARYQEAVEEALNRRAMVVQRRSELAIARQDLEDAVLRAPFSGCIQQRNANVGEYQQEGAPVATLVRMDPLRLRVQVPERGAATVHAGQELRFRVEGDSTVYSAKVKRISPAIAQEGRVVLVEAEVNNPGTLRPGSFVRAEIITDKNSNALAVPAESIITFAGIEKVRVLRDGKVAEQEVETGRRNGALVEVRSGIEKDALVLANPEGARVGEAATPRS